MLAIAPALRAAQPTYASAPFEKTHIYLDRTDSDNESDDVDDTGYPSTLQSPNLLIKRWGEPLAYFNSFAQTGTGLIVFPGHSPSYAEYTLNQSRYADHIALLLMANGAFRVPSEFSDYGRPVAAVTVTFEGGSTVVDTFTIGARVRNYWEGEYVCNGAPWTAFVDNPDYGLSGEHFDEGGLYYDVHEIKLPPDKRALRLEKVRIDAIELSHHCPPLQIYGGVNFHGLSSWMDFEMTNSVNITVITKKQHNPQWSLDPYGGYYTPGGILVGSRKTLGWKGCALTSIAMVHKYYEVQREEGVECTPPVLNDWLQRNQGFIPRAAVKIVNVSAGQAVGDTVWVRDLSGEALELHADVLVEQSLYTNPIATLRLLDPPAASSDRRARVEVRHSTTLMTIGQLGKVYSLVDWAKASGGYSSGTSGAWKADDLLTGNPSLPIQAETEMLQSRPVLLRVDMKNHWVVGTGMTLERSSSPPPLTPGTYKIHDPAYTTDDLNYQYWNNGGPPNAFDRVFACKPTGAPLALASAEADLAGARRTLEGDESLNIAVAGDVSLEIHAPGGGSILLDPLTGMYTSNIPGAFAGHSCTDEDLDPDGSSSARYELIELPDPVDGSYDITIEGADAAAFTVQVVDFDSDDQVSSAIMEGFVDAGAKRTYRVEYSSVPGSPVSIAPVVGVEPHGPVAGRLDLAVGPNPASVDCRLSFRLGSASRVQLTVFDIQGKRVVSLLDDVAEPGERTVLWDLNATDGRRVREGVYFVRLHVGSQSITKRMIVLN